MFGVGEQRSIRGAATGKTTRRGRESWVYTTNSRKYELSNYPANDYDSTVVYCEYTLAAMTDM